MGDSVIVACAVPDSADIAFQIHCLERSAYAAVLRAFCAQSDFLSWAKRGCLAELRNKLKILENEHRECLEKARSNKKINDSSDGLQSKGNTCSTEVMKDTPDPASVLPDAGDTVFQIHCLERAAYASVLRAFCAMTNRLSEVRLLTKLRNELRISHIEHKEVLVEVSSNENIKSLRKFSLANLSVLTKADPSFDVHAVVHDKIGSTGQVSTSSTSCLSLAQRSPISEHSMSTTRDIVVSDSSNGAKEGTYFEPHAVVSSKRLKSVNGLALAHLKCVPSDQLPVAVSAVLKGRTDDTHDSETISSEVKSGCSSSPIFQEKHSESNADQVPSCVDRVRQESGKRKAEVPGIKSHGNKDSDLENGSEIIKLCLTSNLLHKVEILLREDSDPANLEKAKTILKVQEKDLLDAVVKLSEVSYDVANGEPGKLNTHEHDDGTGEEEVLPEPMNSSDKTPPGTPRLGGGWAGSNVKDQGVAAMALSSSSATPTGGTTSSSSIAPLLLPPPPPPVPASPSSGPAAALPALSKKGSRTWKTAEQKWRMWEFAHRVGWSIREAGAANAFCAEVCVSRHALKTWMAKHRHLAKIPPPPLPSPPPPSHHQAPGPGPPAGRRHATAGTDG